MQYQQYEYRQYEFDTPLSVVDDEPQADSDAHVSLGDAVDFELGVTVPQLSLIAGLDAMVDPAEEQWQDRALCAQTDPEAFFPEKGGSTRAGRMPRVRTRQRRALRYLGRAVGTRTPAPQARHHLTIRYSSAPGRSGSITSGSTPR